MSAVIVEMGKRLRDCREYCGFTQQQIADALGLHRPAVSEIEAGNRKVTAEELKRLAKLYCKTIDYFLGEPDPEPTRAVLQAVEGMDEQDREEVLKFATFLRWKRRAEG